MDVFITWLANKRYTDMLNIADVSADITDIISVKFNNFYQ